MHRFLCGCQVPSRERLQGDSELTSLDTVSWDGEGFLICKPHGQRISGWRVPSHRALPLGLAGATDLEWQSFVLLGELPEKSGLEIGTEVIYTTQDLRDSRDPERDFESIAADVQQDRLQHDDDDFSANGNGNGHYSFSNGKPILAGEPHGNAQMKYQRELAQAQVMSRTSKELALRETGF